MAKKYFLYANNVKIEVTKEVYNAYYQTKDRNNYLDDKFNKNVIYLDNHFEGYENNTIEYHYVINRAKVLAEEEHENELIKLLHNVLSRLEEDEKMIVYLYFYKNKSQSQIGQEMNVTQQNISKRLNLIKKKLKKAMNF
ncbi:MAG: sigma-70 family RNA polymerase sigma factor [Synergistaceae bacterium]|nr:sigma-70 family RNA polymerase sigma factor [Synergistaceae bacterium]